MTQQDEVVKLAKLLAFRDYPSAFPYGRAKWVEENYASYIARAKKQINIGKDDGKA